MVPPSPEPPIVEPVRPWSPRLWGAHLLAVVCVGIAVGLGVWQYDAWQDRRAAERVDLTQEAPVPISDVIGADDPFPTAGLGRPVEISGTFLPEGTVLVTGRDGSGDLAGTEGRWLVTPLSVGSPDQPAIPIVRGWLPADTTVADLPAVPTGEVDVVAWLQPSEATTGLPADEHDQVVAEVRIADLQQRVGQDLYGAYAIAQEALPSDAAAGVVPATLDQLPPPGRFTALRNLLYGIEWWVFAAFAAFIWWRYVRDTTRPAPAEQADDGDAEDDAVVSTT